jgi:tripartite-type tricarboxylate transporter receptor subunit TctC
MKLPHRRHLLHLAAGAAALPALSRIVWAQAYPSRPIRLVIPFPPGGAFDALGRPWAERIKSPLGTVVVENIGGGGASLGAAAVARARPDGYTILLGGTLPHVNEALLKSRPLYDPVKDLDPIGSIAANFISIAVHPSVPAQNLKEFIAYAKANSGKLSYGHAGIGSTNHLTGELFKMLAGTPELMQVPYRGMGPAMTDLISGQLTMVVPAVTGQVLEFHRSGKMPRSRSDQPKASKRSTRASHCCRRWLAGPDRDCDTWIACTSRNTGADHRTDCTSHSQGSGGPGLPADADRDGF